MEGEPPQFGDLLTMVMNHLLNGMILQVLEKTYPTTLSNLGNLSRCITLLWCLEHWPWSSLHLMALLSKAKFAKRHGTGEKKIDVVLMVIWDAGLSLTWNLKKMLCTRNLLVQGAIFRFRVKLVKIATFGPPRGRGFARFFAWQKPHPCSQRSTKMFIPTFSTKWWIGSLTDSNVWCFS